MSEDPDKPRSEADAELERETRADRKFSLSEAIGRMAGPGMMKGVSPVTRKRQAEAAIEDFLRLNLTDAGGALRVVLLRGVSDSDLLLRDYDHPLVVLASYARQVLGSDYRLQELVRQADVEWGRVTGERPHFERPGCPPDPDDPYTTESVRASLSHLIKDTPAP
ncbi:MAG: hypothetical protein ABGY75_22935 [Gemmataceae bacterium]